MSTETRYEDSTAKQRRRERREKRQEEFRRRQESERRRRLIVGVGIAVVAVLALALLGAFIFSRANQPATGQRALEVSRDHVARGAPHAPYNTAPATSGPHWSDQGAPVPFGVYEEPVPDEAAVHNLEHGDIFVWYNAEKVTGADRQRLVDFVTKNYKIKVIVSPYPNLDTRYALTAWTWIDKFNDYDEGRIADFISKHVNQGPEFSPNSP
jgi:hypothetical protein